MSNEPISEQFRVVAKSWVDADAAASILEETKSATLSQWMAELGGIPVAHAEREIKSQPRWREYVSSMVEARKRANKLKVQLEYLRMKFSEGQ